MSELTRMREAAETGKCRGFAGNQPKGGAEEHCGPEHGPAVKQPRGAPDHADSDKQQDVRKPGPHLRSDEIAAAPKGAGESADQISRTPPSQGLDSFLP